MASRTNGELGILLRNLRAARGMSHQALAGKAGVNRSTLHRWERGGIAPRLPELEAVLTALDVSPAERMRAILFVDAPRALVRLRDGNALVAVAQSAIGDSPGAGELLRALRLRRGWPLQFVADAMGVHRATASRWESGGSPPPERLASLLRVLEARPEERHALVGRAGTGLSTPSPDSLDTLWRRFAALELDTERGTGDLMDLRFISLEADLWPRALDSGDARRLLAKAFAAHGMWLWYWGRWREGEPLAIRALRLAQPTSAPETFWFQAVTATAYGAGRRYGNGTPAVEVGIVREWLPAATRPEWAHILYQHLTGVLSEAGHIDAALHSNNENRAVAERSGDPELLRRAGHQRAVVLLRGNRLREAAAALPAGVSGQYLSAVFEMRIRAELFLRLDDKREAAHWIEEAYGVTRRHGLNTNGVDWLAAKL